MFLSFFSYQLCLLGLYVTSNVVKLMFIAYFSLTMTAFSVCVNGIVHLLLYIHLYVLAFSACRKAACGELWFIM